MNTTDVATCGIKQIVLPYIPVIPIIFGFAIYH
jgi:hypothetical protein